MDFSDIVHKRYATKKFDGKSIPQEDVDKLFDMIRFSASSFGLQPYKIKVVTDQETKEKLKAASWNQEQVTTASHVLVFCANTDVSAHIDKMEAMLKENGVPEQAISAMIPMMRGFVEKMDEQAMLNWCQKQAYLALGNALNGAKALGFDSCPMEGFDAAQYTEILGLEKSIVPTVVCPIGYGADNPHGKIRYENDELFF